MCGYCLGPNWQPRGGSEIQQHLVGCEVRTQEDRRAAAEALRDFGRLTEQTAPESSGGR